MTFVTALVPCKDGQESIAETVRTLSALHGVDEVVVVDDGSSDDTSAVAASAGARVVTRLANGGKGAALATGVAACAKTDVFLLVDADTGNTSANAARLLEPVLGGHADLSIGVLPSAAGRGGFGAVKNLARIGIFKACGHETQAPLSGQRAVVGDLLRKLVIAPRFGVEVAMTIDAVRQGWRIVEVDVDIEHRHWGKTVAGFVHRSAQGRDVLAALIPRLMPKWLRVLTLLVAVVGVAVVPLTASYLHTRPEGTKPTASGSVRIVLVPGLRWGQDQEAVPPNVTVGSVATGKGDPAAVVRAASRDPKAQPVADVQVDVESPEQFSLGQWQAGIGQRVLIAGIDAPNSEPALRPVLLSGSDGRLYSASTHRSGLVDLVDLVPTARSLAAKAPPSEAQGSALSVISDDPNVPQLRAENASAQFFQAVNPVIIGVYVTFQVLVFSAAIVLGLRKKQRGRFADVGIGIASFPLATYLAQLKPGISGLLEWSALTAAALGIILAMARIGASSALTQLRRVCGLTVVVVVLDVLLGSHLQNGGVFGSSPLLATRYYGLGNPATTLVLLSFVTWSMLSYLQTPTSGRRRLLGVLGTGLALVIGLPGLGADAGGLLVAILSAAGVYVCLARQRIPWRAATLASMGAVVLVFVIGMLDSLRPAAQQTHIGRFVSKVTGEGPNVVVDFVGRRVDANLLSYAFPLSIVLAVLALLGLAALASGRFSVAGAHPSTERVGATLVALAAVLLFWVNDSGIVVLALSAVVLGPLFLALQSQRSHIRVKEVAVT